MTPAEAGGINTSFSREGNKVTHWAKPTAKTRVRGKESSFTVFGVVVFRQGREGEGRGWDGVSSQTQGHSDRNDKLNVKIKRFCTG